METNTNRFIEGIDRDSPLQVRSGVSQTNPSGTSPYDNSYLDAFGWVDSAESNEGFLTTEIGDTLVNTLGFGAYKTIGSCLEGEFIYVFTIDTSNSQSRIVQIHRDTLFAKILAENGLSFNLNYGIKAVARRLYNKKLALYFTDNYNPVKYLVIDDSPLVPTLVTPEQLFLNIQDISISYTLNTNGGSIPCGGIALGVAFVSEDGTVLQYSKPSKTIQIAEDSDGAYNSKNSSVSVDFNIILPDAIPRYIQLYVVKSVGDLNVVSAYLVGSPKYVITNTQTLLYTGYETHEQISIDEISISLAYYRKAKCIDTINNKLILANLSETEFNYTDAMFELGALKLKAGIDFEYISKSSLRDDKKLQETLRSYKRNEVYAFSYSVITDDGVEYGPFHIPGGMGDLHIAPIDSTNIGKFESNLGTYLGTYYSNLYYPVGSKYNDIVAPPDKANRIRHHVIPNLEIMDSELNVRVPKINIFGITDMLAELAAKEFDLYGTTALTDKIQSVKFYRGLRQSNRDKTIISQGLIHPLEHYHGYYGKHNGQVGIEGSVLGNKSLDSVQPTYKNVVTSQFHLASTDPPIVRPAFVKNSWIAGTMKVNSTNILYGNSSINDSFVNYYSPETTFSRLDIGNYRLRLTEEVDGKMCTWNSSDAGSGDYAREDFWTNEANAGNVVAPGFSANGSIPVSNVIIDYVYSTVMATPPLRAIHNENSFYADSLMIRDLQGYAGPYAKTDLEQNSQIFNIDPLAFPDDVKWNKGVVFTPIGSEEGVSLKSLAAPIPNQYDLTAAKSVRVEVESVNRTCYGELGDIVYTEVAMGPKVSIGNLIEFRNGDTYTSFFGYRHSCSFFGEANGGAKTFSIGIVLTSVWVESTYNCQMRHTLVSNVGGYTQGGLPYYDRDSLKNLVGYNIVDNSGTYNSSYSAEYLVKTKQAIPSFITKVVDFPNRVIYSEVSLDGSTVDKYRIFKANNYKDLPNHKGPIWDIFILVGDLFAHCLRSLFKTNMETNTVIQSTTGSELVIGTASLFSTPAQEIVTLDGGFGGTQDSYGGVTTPSGRIFTDRSSGNILIFNGSVLRPIVTGLKHFFINNLNFTGGDLLSNDRPFNDVNNGICGGYDVRHNRYLLTKKVGDGNNANSFTISYSLNIFKWRSRHIYVPGIYISSSNVLLSSALTGLWKHHTGSVLNFRGANSYAEIKFKNTDIPVTPKVLDSFILQMRCYDYTTKEFKYRSSTTDRITVRAETNDTDGQQVIDNELTYSYAWYVDPAVSGKTTVRLVNNRYQMRAPLLIKPNLLLSERVRALNHDITFKFDRAGNDELINLESVDVNYRRSVR